MKPFGTPFGEYLYEVRQQKGWSLRTAAQHAGVAFSRLGEIERGVDPHSGKTFLPSYVVVCRLARAYGLAPDELLRQAGHAPGPELTPEEWALLGAYRRMDATQQAAMMQSVAPDPTWQSKTVSVEIVPPGADADEPANAPTAQTQL